MLEALTPADLLIYLHRIQLHVLPSLRPLDYQLDPARFFHVVAPVYRTQVMPEPVRDRLARRRWHPLASCYLLVARREMLTMTRVRPAFRHRRAQLVGGLVNPTTREAA